MTGNNLPTNESQGRTLLCKIQRAGIPLREVDGGCPFNVLKIAITQYRQDQIAPPTYGFASISGFLDNMRQFLPSDDIWILAIMVSDLMEWHWKETRERGEGSPSNSAVDHLGTLPIVVPRPDDLTRLGALVEKIVTEVNDEPSVLELRSDIDDRIFSIYNLTCAEIVLVIGDDVEW